MNKLRLYKNNPIQNELLSEFSFKDKLIADLDNTSPYLTFIDTDSNKTYLNYKEVAEIVFKLSRRLKEIELVKPGEKIGLLFENGYELIIYYLALINLDATIVPLNPNESKETLRDLSINLELRFILFSFDQNLINAHFEPSILKSTLTTTWQNDFSIFTSSGTTGVSKAVVHKKESILANLKATISAHAIDQSTVIYNCLPLYHVNAFNFAFLATWFSNAQLIHQRKFSLSFFPQIITSCKITIINLVPPLIRLLNQDPRIYAFFNTVKYAVSAASYLSKTDAIEFYKKFNCPIVQSYGLSESVNFSTIGPTVFDSFSYDDYLALDEERLSIGSEVFGNEIQIDQPNDEGVGELVITGWNIFLYYYNNPAATQLAFKNDAFHTGDLGYVKVFNGKKFFFISGRSKDVFKHNGVLIYLEDLDKVLLKNHDIKNCIFCQYLDHHEEKLGLLIDTHLSEVEIRLFLKNNFPYNLRISQIIYAKDLPITNTGKKRRGDVKKLFETGR